MSRHAVDTSVAVPYLMRSHDAHGTVRAALAGRKLVLTAHSLAETYSVLTRLPGDARVDASDAVTLIEANFGDTALLDPDVAANLPRVLADLGITGGAVYDALVAMAAKSEGIDLITRDLRAKATYVTVGVSVEVLAAS